ncbi:NEDD8-specific protease 1-like [Prunus avium]|uniref:NEDD8-specific protease 1-like n=1 Tax=Prunus avium TaxID=42229 RepID=A0A6P5RY86_PRUAV|nr:NEDD8-specific protease 1-like [Prunus avium]
MDIPNPTRLRPKKSTTPSERFLGAYPHALPNNPTPATSIGDELNEDDVFWSNDVAAEPSHRSIPSSSTSSTPRHHSHHHHHHHHHKGFSQPESFGILAALPEREPSSSNHRPQSHFYHKSSVSSSASSSPSQLIPAIPKPPHDRFNHPALSSVKYHQSAPVNVPVLANAMRKHREFDAVDDDHDDDEGEGEMLPPHEIVARSSSHTPMLACSVLEGVGRTLKGRDLRRVRNAVWRQTGFLD